MLTRYRLNSRKPFLSVLPRLLIISGLLLISSTSLGDTEKEYQQRLKELATTIGKLQDELKSAKSSKDKLQQSLQQSEEEIGTLSKKVETIKEALAREKKQLSQLKTQRNELEQQRKQQQAHMGHGIRQAYQLGRQSQIKLLLNQEEPHRVSRLLRYHDYVVSAHQDKVNAYLSTIEQLNSLEPAIVSSKQRLEKSHQQLLDQQQQLQSSQKQRQQSLSRLNGELKTKGLALSQLSLDQQRLQDLLDEATQALANLTLPKNTKAFKKVRGRLPLPTKGKITHRYGSTQFDGQLKRNGIFIANRSGAKVVSVHYGRVIFSDYLRGHGLLLIIDHGDGYMSLYAHNQTLLKEIGDWVSSGETIATIGNSGGQQQTGLYFEIRHKGRPQNPQPWLARG